MSDQVAPFPIRPLQPGAYSRTDASALADAGQGIDRPVIAILGDVKGGTPNTALRFRSPQTLKSVLRSGPGLDSARVAALAQAGEGGDILFVRVGSSITPSTKALNATTGTGLTLTSKDFGAWTLGIRVTVAANNKVSVAFTDSLGTTYTEIYDLGSAATAQQIADAINGRNPAWPASSYVTATAGAGTMPLATLAQTALTGGADASSIVSGDWTVGLSVLETEQVDLVVVATGDSTVHAQAKAHCALTSGVQARKERVQVAGGVIGETGTQVAARAAALLDNRTQLAWPGGWIYDETGTPVLYDPFVVAAGIAGEHSRLPDPATSLVHTTLPWLIDTERALSTIPGGELDVALRAGVTPINDADSGGIWIVDSLSTNRTVPMLADFHKIRTADAVSKYARTRLESKFVGGKTLDGTANSIFQEATSILDTLVRSQLIRAAGAVVVEEDPSTAGAFLITLPVVLPDTNKYLLITVALRPPVAATATA